MGLKKKLLVILIITLPNITFLSSIAEEEENILSSVVDQIQIITKDLKTLEKAVYQKSDATLTSTQNSLKSDGLNEDILTKHLLKLNEIEDQFRELTNKFEEVNFKLDKLSTRVTKIQSDTQLRFSDLESGSLNTEENKTLKELETLFKQSVDKHLISDRKIGLFLSGGTVQRLPRGTLETGILTDVRASVVQTKRWGSGAGRGVIASGR